MTATLNEPSTEQVKRFLDALVAHDRQTCEAMTASALKAGISPLVLYQRLYQPALYRIGELWAANQLSVASEHMATVIVESLMNEVYPHLVHSARHGRRALLATVEDELHQVGLKMAADVFEMHGWDVSILTAGSPTDALIEAINREHPDVVGLSCSVLFHADTLLGTLERLQLAFPSLPILIGGQAIAAGGEALVPEHLKVTSILTLDQLEMWLQIEARD